MATTGLRQACRSIGKLPWQRQRISIRAASSGALTLKDVGIPDETRPWNHIWAPNLQRPQTEGERIAAAEKYNLLPEDYKPFERNYGDYPDLEIVCENQRSEDEIYDMPELHRNWNEPLNTDYNAFKSQRLDLKDPRFSYYSVSQMAVRLSLFFGIFILLTVYGPSRRPPLMPKQYPISGEKHYTFEPAE